MAGSDRELPVAVFDSGVGGLTVLHECLVSLPHEDFLYLGDTARFPYGDRPADELLGFARELAGILLDRGAKLLVVACNSATAAALPALREELEGRVPVVGVVTPESRLAAAATRTAASGLIATPATVASGAYARALGDAAPAAELHAVASAELAPLIQEGGEVDQRVVACVDGLCRPLKRGRRRHRDPRLHALPARAARAPARARPRRVDRQLGRGDRRRGRREAARGRRGAATTTGAGATASSPPATPRSSAAWVPASCSCRSPRSSTWVRAEPARRAA